MNIPIFDLESKSDKTLHTQSNYMYFGEMPKSEYFFCKQKPDQSNGPAGILEIDDKLNISTVRCYYLDCINNICGSGGECPAKKLVEKVVRAENNVSRNYYMDGGLTARQYSEQMLKDNPETPKQLWDRFEQFSDFSEEKARDLLEKGDNISLLELADPDKLYELFGTIMDKDGTFNKNNGYYRLPHQEFSEYRDRHPSQIERDKMIFNIGAAIKLLEVSFPDKSYYGPPAMYHPKTTEINKELTCRIRGIQALMQGNISDKEEMIKILELLWQNVDYIFLGMYYPKIRKPAAKAILKILSDNNLRYEEVVISKLNEISNTGYSESDSRSY